MSVPISSSAAWRAEGCGSKAQALLLQMLQAYMHGYTSHDTYNLGIRAAHTLLSHLLKGCTASLSGPQVTRCSSS